MTLSEFVYQQRNHVFEALQKGILPTLGEIDADRWATCKVLGPPQLGPTRYEPNSIVIEFLYPASTGKVEVLSVRIDAPERIVFLAVPDWVIESIWQGEIAGSYEFESRARALVAAFVNGLEAEANAANFGERARSGRAG